MGLLRKYRCSNCGQPFEAEDPPDTIPASFVFCPLCGGFPEEVEVE